MEQIDGVKLPANPKLLKAQPSAPKSSFFTGVLEGYRGLCRSPLTEIT